MSMKCRLRWYRVSPMDGCFDSTKTTPYKLLMICYKSSVTCKEIDIVYIRFDPRVRLFLNERRGCTSDTPVSICFFFIYRLSGTMTCKESVKLIARFINIDWKWFPFNSTFYNVEYLEKQQIKTQKQIKRLWVHYKSYYRRKIFI